MRCVKLRDDQKAALAEHVACLFKEQMLTALNQRQGTNQNEYHFADGDSIKFERVIDITVPKECADITLSDAVTGEVLWPK